MSSRIKMAYGVDVSDHSAVVVCARGRRSFETVHAADAAGVPDAVRGRIAADVASGRAVSAAALAAHETIFRRVSAPFPRLDRALKVLPSVLDVQLPFPLEQCTHVFTGAAPDGRGGIEAVAIAARRDDVAAALQRLAGVGVDPVVLDHEGLALWRHAAAEHGPAGDTGRIVLHLAPDRTTLVHGRVDRLLGTHGSRRGAGADPAEIAGRMHAWLRAQAALEVSPRTEWILTGAGAADAERVAALLQHLDIRGATTVADPAAFLARALAAGALAGDDVNSCNLRIGALAHPLAHAVAAAQSRRHLSLALAAAACLMVANVVVLAYAAARNDGVQREIQRVARDLSGQYAPKGQEVLVVQRELDRAAAQLRPFQSMLTAGTSRRLDEILALCRTNGAAVSKIDLTSDTLGLVLAPATAGGADRISTALRLAGWQIQQQKRDALVEIEGRR